MAGTADWTAAPTPHNVWLDALVGETRWSSGGRTTVVSAYLAGSHGDEVVSLGKDGELTATKPWDEETAAMRAAMRAYEAVCQVDFRSVPSLGRADVVWSSVGPTDAPGGTRGYAYFPGSVRGSVARDEQSVIAINWQSYEASSRDTLLAPGSSDFAVYVHELGHALGLAHTHDRGSGTSIMPGVHGPFGDFGRWDMNQGLYTTMSYNWGWSTGPQGGSPSQDYGYQVGPMALDIAAVQLMYGANRTTERGRSSYELPGADKVGTAWSCIWDAGGIDRIEGAEGRANLIDLRAATLRDAPGGGGWASYAEGVHGGFTIAHGAVIENAVGGRKGDLLRGNEAANHLFGHQGEDGLAGGDGRDVLLGGLGDDRLRGGRGDDRLIGGRGADWMAGGDGADTFVFECAWQSPASGGHDRIADFTRGRDRLDLSAIDADGHGHGVLRLDHGHGHGHDLAEGEIGQAVTHRGLLLSLNLDGDAEAEMTILLKGLHRALDASDLLL